MDLDLPQEFSIQARANITTAEIEADRAVIKARDWRPVNSMITHGLGAPPPVEEAVEQYVMTIFGAYAHEACELGRRNVWIADHISNNVQEFLRSLLLTACGKYRARSYFSRILDERFNTILPDGWRWVEKKPEWIHYQDELINVASLQSGQPNAAIPSRASLNESAQATPSERQDPASLIAARADMLAKYKEATGNPSNRSIYLARNSNIHKPQFHEWIKGSLPDTSQTCINFERFLREKKRPIPRTPKTD